MNNAQCAPKEHKHSYLRSILVLICVTAMVGVIFTLFRASYIFRLQQVKVWYGSVVLQRAEVIQISVFVFPQILVIIGLAHALVVFRVIAAVLLADGSWEFLSTHSNSGAMMLGAILHYLIITVMTRVRRCLSICLPVSDILCDSDYVFFSLQINRIVAMKLCEIGMFTYV